MKKEYTNLVYGRNPVIEAIKNEIALSVIISEGFHDNKLMDLIKTFSLAVRVVKQSELNQMCPGANQGIACFIKPYEYQPLEKILKIAKSQTNPIIVMLDKINDPHNFGAILRCCEIFGVAGVIVGKHDQVPLNQTVAKTSAGAINYVPVASVGNLTQTIKLLQDSGYWVVASSGNAELDYRSIKYDFPTVLVIGNEGDGVSNLVLKNSDYVVKIPMYGKVNSLNASVATGILLAQIKG